MKTTKKNVCIVGGGGSKGAFNVGYVCTLKPTYTHYFATSTGALMVPLMALEKWKQLENLYINISDKDMGLDKLNNRSSFYILFLFLRKVITKKTGLTNYGKVLESKLRENYSQTEHELLVKKNIEIRVTTTCLSHTKDKVSYHSNLTTDYEKFIKAIIASASVPLIAELVQVNDHEWDADGGIRETVPTEPLIKEKFDVIDLYLSYPKVKKIFTNKTKNIVMTLVQVIKVLHEEVTKNDLDVLIQKNIIPNKVIRPSYTLTTNALSFNKDKMQKWFNMGKELALTEVNFKKIKNVK